MNPEIYTYEYSVLFFLDDYGYSVIGKGKKIVKKNAYADTAWHKGRLSFFFTNFSYFQIKKKKKRETELGTNLKKSKEINESDVRLQASHHKASGVEPP